MYMYNAMHPLVMLLIHGLLNSPFGDFFFHLTFSCSSVTHVSDSQDIQHNLMRSPTAPLVVVQLFSVTVLLRTVPPCPAFKILNRHPCSLSTTNKGFCFFFFFSLPWQCSNVCCVLTHFCRSAERWIEVVTPSLRPTVAAAWTCNDSGLHSASAAFTSDGTAQ